ncbi:MAG: hypothetical protein ABIH21_04705, partial [Patescibacteria group bacterium]
NPKLADLQMPKMPMIKRVELMKNEWCEDLIKDKKFIIGEHIILESGSTKKCGAFGKIIKTPDGSEVADGMTCMFKTCNDSDKTLKCINTPKDGPHCVDCKFVNPYSSKGIDYGLSPSPALCNSLSGLSIGTQTGYFGTYHYCLFTRVDELFSDTVDRLQGTCAEVKFNCSALPKECSAYGDVFAVNSKHAVQLKNMIDIIGTDSTFRNICSKDICGLAGYLRNESGDVVSMDKCYYNYLSIENYIDEHECVKVGDERNL